MMAMHGIFIKVHFSNIDSEYWILNASWMHALRSLARGHFLYFDILIQETFDFYSKRKREEKIEG